MSLFATTARSLVVLASTVASLAAAQDAPKPDSSYVKLLKKAPEERVGQIVEILGKRGDADDFAYLFGRTIDPNGFSPAVRLKAMGVMAESALTRNVRPAGNLGGLAPLIASSDPAVRLASIRLAGHWKLESSISDLSKLAGSKDVDPTTRSAAFEAMASIGGDPARQAIEVLTAADRPSEVRIAAVAALARFDVDRAADQVAEILAGPPIDQEITPLVAAFLDRQGGADKLASAISRKKLGADNAKLGLRAIYALGRADESLVAAFSKAAGIEADPKPLDKAEMDRLVLEVGARGNATRGEAIFRRPEINCIKCHALSGAGGGVGPELSALGLSSPVDYLVYSIMVPDQSIKEEYQTRVVLTDDGRVLQGIVVEEDDKRMILRDATAELRTVPIASIEDSKKGGSLMPKGLANMLTRNEFVDLVRFLSELGKPGPYAIKSVPTIQRWRVLKTAPDEIAEVLSASPDQWSAAYALTAGSLPLAEITTQTEAKLPYIQGEIKVSSAGPITFRFNNSKGLTTWLDDQPLPVGDAPTAEVAEGIHKLTIKLDPAIRGDLPIRVEVVRPEGSTIEFVVVGGR